MKIKQQMEKIGRQLEKDETRPPKSNQTKALQMTQLEIRRTINSYS